MQCKISLWTKTQIWWYLECNYKKYFTKFIPATVVPVRLMSPIQAVMVSLVIQTDESVWHAAEYKRTDMLLCKVSDAMVIVGCSNNVVPP